jgi:hypothetical protein
MSTASKLTAILDYTVIITSPLGVLCLIIMKTYPESMPALVNEWGLNVAIFTIVIPQVLRMMFRKKQGTHHENIQ